MLATGVGDVGNVPTLEITPVSDIRSQDAVFVPPSGEVAHSFTRLLVVEEHAELEAVSLEAISAATGLWIVEGGGVSPTGEHIEVLRVVHEVKPDGVVVAVSLHVHAGEGAAGEVPVADLAIDHHLLGGEENAGGVVLGFGRAEVGGRQDREA